MSSQEIDFHSRQYALYFALAFEVMAAFFFLLTTIYVVSDRQKAEEAEKLAVASNGTVSTNYKENGKTIAFFISKDLPSENLPVDSSNIFAILSKFQYCMTTQHRTLLLNEKNPIEKAPLVSISLMASLSQLQCIFPISAVPGNYSSLLN